MNLIHFLNYINLAKFADNVSKDKTDEQTLNKLLNNDGAGKIREKEHLPEVPAENLVRCIVP